MKQMYKTNKGLNSTKYRENIYIFSISLTLISIFLIPVFIYSATMRGERASPTLYTSFFILLALVFGHLAELIKILERNK